MRPESRSDWRNHEVKIISANCLDLNTSQTPSMTRAAAINHARAGASKIWAGTLETHPNATTGPHHHGKLESVIYEISGFFTHGSYVADFRSLIFR